MATNAEKSRLFGRKIARFLIRGTGVVANAVVGVGQEVYEQAKPLVEKGIKKLGELGEDDAPTQTPPVA